MKEIENTKHYQALYLNGKDNVSFRVFPYQNEKRRIGKYTAWYHNGEAGGEAVVASENTSDKFSILLNENQARAVIGLAGEEYAVDDRDAMEGTKKLQGVFVLMWTDCDAAGSIHFLWIDCRAETICRSICLDTYGYKLDEVMGLFSNMFHFMAKGIAQIQNGKLPDFELAQNSMSFNAKNKSL